MEIKVVPHIRIAFVNTTIAPSVADSEVTGYCLYTNDSINYNTVSSKVKVTVLPKAVTVTADDQTKYRGDPNGFCIKY